MNEFCQNIFLHTQSASTLINRTISNGDMAVGGAVYYSVLLCSVQCSVVKCSKFQYFLHAMHCSLFQRSAHFH